MTRRRFRSWLSSLALGFALVASLPSPAPARDGEIAEASRLPGGINPAEIDWRCSIMAGRLDRAYLNCAAFDLGPTRNPALDLLLLEKPAPVRGPLRMYDEAEARRLGLIPPR